MMTMRWDVGRRNDRRCCCRCVRTQRWMRRYIREGLVANAMLMIAPLLWATANSRLSDFPLFYACVSVPRMIGISSGHGDVRIASLRQTSGKRNTRVEKQTGNRRRYDCTVFVSVWSQIRVSGFLNRRRPKQNETNIRQRKSGATDRIGEERKQSGVGVVAKQSQNFESKFRHAVEQWRRLAAEHKGRGWFMVVALFHVLLHGSGAVPSERNNRRQENGQNMKRTSRPNENKGKRRLPKSESSIPTYSKSHLARTTQATEKKREGGERMEAKSQVSVRTDSYMKGFSVKVWRISKLPPLVGIHGQVQGTVCGHDEIVDC